MKSRSIPDGEIHTLSNGLRIWTMPNPMKDCKQRDKVHIGVLIYSGTYTEYTGETEYNHIIEHLIAVLPSEKYPNSRHNNILMEQNGISAFGTVDDYKTHVWLEGFNGNFDLMFDLFSNGLIGFHVDNVVFKQEISAVLTELTDWCNNPFLKLDEFQHKLLYPNHPISIPIKHHIANVKSATPEKVENYFNRILDPKRTIIYVSGKLNNRSYKYAINKIRDTFKHLTSPSNPALNYNKLANYKPKNIKNNIYFVKSNTSTTKIEWLWLTNVKYGDYECYIIEAIVSIMQDKLFDYLRMDKGLIYTIKLESVCDPINTYLSNLKASTDVINKNTLKKVIKQFVIFIDELEYSITHDDLLQFRRKIYRKYQDKLSNCTLESMIENHADNLLFLNTTHSLKYELNKYLNISLKDIRTFIKNVINNDRMYIFYSGKHKLC